jgi:hypothetical protein
METIFPIDYLVRPCPLCACNGCNVEFVVTLQPEVDPSVDFYMGLCDGCKTPYQFFFQKFTKQWSVKGMQPKPLVTPTIIKFGDISLPEGVELQSARAESSYLAFDLWDSAVPTTPEEPLQSLDGYDWHLAITRVPKAPVEPPDMIGDISDRFNEGDFAKGGLIPASDAPNDVPLTHVSDCPISQDGIATVVGVSMKLKEGL